MFLGHLEFIETLKECRSCYIGGKLGSGKTLLATALAFELWRTNFVDHMYFNYPCVGNTEEKYYTDFVCVLDEGGKVLGHRTFSKNNVESWIADLRKRNVVLLTPSRRKVDKELREMVVMKGFMLGNLIWNYRWLYQDDLGSYGGSFFLVNPKFYFGSYLTKYIVDEKDIEKLRDIMRIEDDKQDKNDIQSVLLQVDEGDFTDLRSKKKNQTLIGEIISLGK